MKYKHHSPMAYVNDIYDERSAEMAVQDLIVQLDDINEIHDYIAALMHTHTRISLFVDYFNQQFKSYDDIHEYRERYFSMMGGQEAVEARYKGGRLDPDREEYYEEIRRNAAK